MIRFSNYMRFIINFRQRMLKLKQLVKRLRPSHHLYTRMSHPRKLFLGQTQSLAGQFFGQPMFLLTNDIVEYLARAHHSFSLREIAVVVTT